uniref:Uncharacterized protein n=1 Tax=Anopheles albimanus TaxID=7167 RepID=A0A182FZ87_ANOAL
MVRSLSHSPGKNRNRETESHWDGSSSSRFVSSVSRPSRKNATKQIEKCSPPCPLLPTPPHPPAVCCWPQLA